MDNTNKPAFGLRYFLAYCSGIPLLFGLGGANGRWIAIQLLVVVPLYFVIFLLGSAFAKQFPTKQNPTVRHRRTGQRSINDGPLIMISCYLVVCIAWYMLTVSAFTPAGFKVIWQLPSFLGLSVGAIEHLVLIGFHIYLYTNFFGDCYRKGYVSQWNCVATACYSYLLIMSQYAVLYA